MDAAPEEPTAEALRKLRAEIREELGKGDRRVSDALSKKLTDYHTELMDALTDLKAEVVAHSSWIVSRDNAQAVIDREKATQQQKELWIAEAAAVKAKDRADRRARYGRIIPYMWGGMATVAGSSILYVLENLNTLYWDLQTQIIAGLLVSIAIGSWLLLKYGP